MRKSHKKISVFLAIAMLISVFHSGISFSLVNAAVASNLVINGDFETDSDSNWKPDSWTFSNDEVSYYDDKAGASGNALKVQTTGTNSVVTVSQTIHGVGGNRLPDGVYTLEAYVKGGQSLASLNSLTLGVTNTGLGNITGSAITGSNISATDYTKIILDNIKVNNGSCNVVISVDMNEGDSWKVIFYLDDVSFYKTGEINYASNGSFETDATDDWAPDNWTTSGPGITCALASGWDHTTGSSKKLKIDAWEINGTYEAAVTQTNTGLPDGVYDLEMWVAGGGTTLDSFVLTAQGQRSSEQKGNIVGSEYTKLEFKNIKVSSGFCTIGLSAVLTGGATGSNAGGWLNIDDVALYRTRGLNMVQNGDFETGWGDGWTTSSGAISCSINSTWDHTSGSTKSLGLSAWEKNGSYRVDVTQSISGLPNGVYNLEVWAAGGGNSLDSFKLTAGGQSSSEMKTSIGGSFTKLEFKDIEVNSGSCIIGISSEMTGGEPGSNQGGWLNIDDFDFYKVREIGEKVAFVTSIPAITANIEINEEDTETLKTILPAKVTAQFDDGSSAPVGVTWDALVPSQYTNSGLETTKVGTMFTVQGTVANTNIKAVANVTVTNKASDVNGDSVTNVGDLAVAAYYFGSGSYSTNWSLAKASDINGDLKVDITDLKLITTNIH